MNALTVTDHAAVRMAQRCINAKDVDLIALLGTEIDDGYLVTAHDYQQVERQLKHFLDRIRRMQGKRLVVANGRIVTAYHCSKKQERRLLRTAHGTNHGE
jgi:hypothetical protein